jgi:outer membrane protein assembly factor BamB
MSNRSWAPVLIGVLAVMLLSIPHSPVVRATGIPIPAWPQWAQNSQHTGFVNVAGQPLARILADVIYDPLVPDEMAALGGDLLAHYQTPLVDGDDVFMESKSGTFNVNTYSTERWHQNRFTWQRGSLVRVWTFDSDWVAPGSAYDFWEPVYHAVLANGFVYDPGAGGTIFKLNRADGSVVARINPFDDLDGNTFTASPLSADSAGNVYYNVVRVAGRGRGNFFSSDVHDSWLVRVASDDSAQKVSYGDLLSHATIIGDAVPGPKDGCKVEFAASQLPWPPSPSAVPSTTACGSERAALNIAPAIAPDGTIYTVSKAHFVTRYNYLIAVNRDLTGRWAASLRGHLHDGCHSDPLPAANGSILPKNGDPGGCRVGATEGVDPGTNEPGPGRVFDDASSTPTVAPDGSIFIGTLTRYNYDQGHLMHFSSSGAFQGAFRFGWDVTPAIWSHDGTYSVVIKNNQYSGGSYCDVEPYCPGDRTASNAFSPEAYFVTQLSPKLIVEWNFQNTNTESCTRGADGTITCTSDHPHGFEWCVNAPMVDANGVVYANSEDGNLYAINQGGTLKMRIFQQLALGAAYTPASLGSDGKIYSQNSGHLFVVGQ